MMQSLTPRVGLHMPGRCARHARHARRPCRAGARHRPHGIDPGWARARRPESTRKRARQRPPAPLLVLGHIGTASADEGTASSRTARCHQAASPPCAELVGVADRSRDGAELAPRGLIITAPPPSGAGKTAITLTAARAEARRRRRRCSCPKPVRLHPTRLSMPRSHAAEVNLDPWAMRHGKLIAHLVRAFTSDAGLWCAEGGNGPI